MTFNVKVMMYFTMGQSASGKKKKEKKEPSRKLKQPSEKSIGWTLTASKQAVSHEHCRYLNSIAGDYPPCALFGKDGGIH